MRSAPKTPAELWQAWDSTAKTCWPWAAPGQPFLPPLGARRPRSVRLTPAGVGRPRSPLTATPTSDLRQTQAGTGQSRPTPAECGQAHVCTRHLPSSCRPGLEPPTPARRGQPQVSPSNLSQAGTGPGQPGQTQLCAGRPTSALLTPTKWEAPGQPKRHPLDMSRPGTTPPTYAEQGQAHFSEGTSANL